MRVSRQEAAPLQLNTAAPQKLRSAGTYDRGSYQKLTAVFYALFRAAAKRQKGVLYEKHGQPLEVVIKNVIQTKFIRPKERPYQTENFYAVIEKQRKLEKEVSAIVNGRTKNHDPRGKKSREA